MNPKLGVMAEFMEYLDKDWRPTESWDRAEYMPMADKVIINHGPLKRGQHRYAHIMRTTTRGYSSER
jgi:hypothetical protein